MSVAFSINGFARRAWLMGLVMLLAMGLLLALEGALAFGGNAVIANGHWGSPSLGSVANGHWNVPSYGPVANGNWHLPAHA